MSKRIYLVLPAIMIVLGFFVNDAYALLRYPFAKVTVRVVDYETGEPIEGAKAYVRFRQGGWDPKYEMCSGLSDKDGKYTARGQSAIVIHYGADYDGYYSGGGEYIFDATGGPLKFRHTPWNPTLTARLRKKGNKIAMYAIQTYGLKIPELNKPIGYDLMEADWVAPYGNGKVNDFILTVTKDYKDDSNYSGTLELTFSNKYDGIYVYPIDKNYHSGPPLPYFAPEDGYQDKLIKRIEKLPGKKQSFNYDRKQHYFFRVRSTEKNGKLESAMYGKLYHDFYFNVHYVVKKNKDKLPGISFEYYLNPDGTRNTEFKNDKNLIKKFSKTAERVYGP